MLDEKAAKVAQEIEGTAAGGNIHVAQERGQAVDTGALTEEDLHSGVLRSEKDVKTALGSGSHKTLKAASEKVAPKKVVDEFVLRRDTISCAHCDPCTCRMTQNPKSHSNLIQMQPFLTSSLRPRHRLFSHLLRCILHPYLHQCRCPCTHKCRL